jgi:hypothetical protein
MVFVSYVSDGLNEENTLNSSEEILGNIRISFY